MNIKVLNLARSLARYYDQIANRTVQLVIRFSKGEICGLSYPYKLRKVKAQRVRFSYFNKTALGPFEQQKEWKIAINLTFVADSAIPQEVSRLPNQIFGTR